MGSFGDICFFNELRIWEEEVVCGTIRLTAPVRCPCDVSPIPIRQNFWAVVHFHFGVEGLECEGSSIFQKRKAKKYKQ